VGTGLTPSQAYTARTGGTSSRDTQSVVTPTASWNASSSLPTVAELPAADPGHDAVDGVRSGPGVEPAGGIALSRSE